jgi:hypothetical protein
MEIDPDFRPLWDELRLSGLLWHRTSPAALERIMASAEIAPRSRLEPTVVCCQASFPKPRLGMPPAVHAV